MAPAYICEFEITFDIYNDWVKHPLGKKARKNRMKRLLWKTAGVFIAVFVTLIGVFLPDNAALFIGIAFTAAMAFLLLFSARIATKRQYAAAIAENGGQPWIRSFAFSDAVKMADFRTTAEYKYAQLSRITEDAGYYYLWLGGDYVLRIPKASFTKGSPNAFPDFIRSKLKKRKGR